jgi:four helix bundle protein
MIKGIKLFNMNTVNSHEWNKIVYYVSDVYRATKCFKAGNAERLGNKIRQSAISLSVAMNDLSFNDKKGDFARLYPLLSSISVLETYLQLAKKHGFLKDTEVLDEKLSEIKVSLQQIIQSGNI